MTDKGVKTILIVLLTAVTVTAYTASKEETDDTPTITASNQKVREGICALSRDLEKKHNLKFGDIIFLEGFGFFEFQDRMHKRWKNRVDIFFHDKQRAIEFGVKESFLYKVKGEE